MKRAFLLFLLQAIIVFAEQDSPIGATPPLSFSDGDPSGIVAGCVSVIDGVYFETEVDLVIPGALPIALRRTYDSHSGCWHFHPGSHITAQMVKKPDETNELIARTAGFDGSYITFLNPNPSKVDHSMTPHVLYQSAGYTNCGKGEISGKNNMMNQRFNLKTKTLTTGGGHKLHYIQSKIPDHYWLQTQIEPNKNRLLFNYEMRQGGKLLDDCYLNRITAKNPSNNITYGSIWTDANTYIESKREAICYFATDNRSVNYYYNKKLENDFVEGKFARLYNPIINRVEGGNNIPTTYGYKHGRLTKKTQPDKKIREIHYYHDRVDKLDDPLTGLTRFSYNKEKRTTSVENANKNKTVYEYNKEKRLIKIDTYNKDNKIDHSIKFDWWFNGTLSDSGNLLSRSLCNHQGKPEIIEWYSYDDQQNATGIWFFGTITGNPTTPLQLNGKNTPTGGEVFKKTSWYSGKGYNNLLSETDGRLLAVYEYLPESDQVSSRILYSDNKKIQRTFYRYDPELTVLIEKIEDDGTGDSCEDLSNVTERRIIRITPISTIDPTTKRHCLGYPEVEEEYYYDLAKKKEKLLSRKINTYTRQGWLIQQKIYDSNSVHLYTLTKKYDNLGNVIEENDALGNITYRKFDRNGNKIEETAPNGLIARYEYSNGTRLTKESLFTSSEKPLETHYTYDPIGNVTHTIDPYGNTTECVYDINNRVIKKILPQVQNTQDELILPEENITYDLLGNPASITDANGHVINTTFNMYKKPLVQDFSDGTQLKCFYNLDGTLQKEITKTGAYILYEYDSLRRVLSKTTYSPDDTPLSSESYTYNSFHKTSETDVNGTTTFFEYDGAGRLVKESREDKLILTEYDPLGRPYITKEKTGPNQWKITTKTYDLLNRITDETITNDQGETLLQSSYAYDESSNVIEEWSYTQAGPAITHKSYDLLNRLIRLENPLGEVFTTEYDDEYINAQGQNVQKTIETDPLGQQTITIYDTHHRVSSVEQKNHNGETLSYAQSFYDAVGNRTKFLNTICYKGVAEKTVTTAWYYNSVNQVTRLVEAEGSNDEKITEYTYNAFGQKEQIIKPNGTILYHTYDSLGRLSTLHSSDHTINEEYHYDANGNLIQFINHITNTTSTRSYNAHNEVIAEKLGNSLSLSYTRDSQGRPTSIILPDNTAVTYIYDPLFLRSVSYEGHIHRYTDYDQSGQLVRQELIKNGGAVEFTYDLGMRLTSIQSPTWKEDHITYDPVGNLTSYQITDSAGGYTTHFTYDDLYQLTSEEGHLAHTYDYDSLQNRRNKDQTPYHLNDLHQLLSQGETFYTYDKNGNLIYKKVGGNSTQFFYDALDRLTRIIENDKRTTFTYDSFHRRLTRVEEKYTPHSSQEWTTISEDRFVYQGRAEIGTFRNNKFNQLRILGRGIKGDIGAAVLVREINTNPVSIFSYNYYAPLHDHNGNLCALINGSIRESYRYTAFGEETFYNSSGTPFSSPPKSPWRFSSKRKEGSLVHFGLRDYDPSIGRWVTADPLGYEDGPNLYAYVHNNPLTHLDAFGLFGFNRNRQVNAYCPGPGEGSSRPRPPEGGGPVARALDYSIKLPGRAVETIGNHAIPIPGLSNVVGAIGRGMQGQAPTWHSASYHPSCSVIVGEEHGEKKGVRRVQFNGILTTYNDAYEVARKTADALQQQVHLVYNSTHGFILDIMCCIAGKLGYPTNPDKIGAEVLRNLHSQIKNDPEGKIISEGHSQGAIHLYNTSYLVSKEVRDRMEVRTYGGGSMIPKWDYKDSKNYICDTDPIPQIANFFSITKNRIRSGNIIKVQSQYRAGFGHPIEGEPYKRTRDALLQDDLSG